MRGEDELTAAGFVRPVGAVGDEVALGVHFGDALPAVAREGAVWTRGWREPADTQSRPFYSHFHSHPLYLKNGQRTQPHRRGNRKKPVDYTGCVSIWSEVRRSPIASSPML